MQAIRRDVFQAIADPTRRQILQTIGSKLMTPNAVADSFDVSRQAISKHIKILTECGLISIRPKGRERFCQVEPNKLKEVTNWLSDFHKNWEERFDALDNLLEKMKKDSSS